MKKPLGDRQRAFRDAHRPEGPPFLGIWVREGDCALLAQGLVTDSVRQMVTDALKEFWPQDATQTAVNE